MRTFSAHLTTKIFIFKITQMTQNVPNQDEIVICSAGFSKQLISPTSDELSENCWGGQLDYPV